MSYGNVSYYFATIPISDWMKFNNVATPYLAYREKKKIALYKMSKSDFD